jgi:hypothetical protein
MSLSDEDKKYYRNDQAIYKFHYNRSVLIEHFRDLSTSPLLKSQCLEDAILKSLNVLNHQQATNFLITIDQWSKILELTQEI